MGTKVKAGSTVKDTPAKADKAKKVKKGPAIENRGIGKRAKELIIEGKNLKETLEIIHKEFPGTKMGSNSYNWYRSKLVQEGLVERKRVPNGEGKAVKAKASKKAKAGTEVPGATPPVEAPAVPA